MQAYRDLLWSLFSPSLLTMKPELTPQVINRTSLRHWLQETKHDVHFEESVQPLSPRLGLYYEKLIHYYLSGPGFDVLHFNFQIKRNKITLGAFDFIYKYKQEIIHRETAVKFFLGIPSQNGEESSLANWWGPNKVDRLDKKVHRLLNHQICLSDYPECKQVLLEQNICINRREVDLKGYLFYPMHSDMPPPTGANPKHLRGYWLSISDFDTLSHEPHWMLIPRLKWLSRIKSPSIQTLTYAELKKQLESSFEQHDTPLLVANLNHVHNQYIEKQRFFITPSNWY